MYSRFCTNCGAGLTRGSHFCSQCGRSIQSNGSQNRALNSNSCTTRHVHNHRGPPATMSVNKSGLQPCPQLQHDDIDHSMANVATVVGECGAWRSIASEIRRCGHTVSNPDDVACLLLSLRQNREPSIARKRSESQQAIHKKTQQIATLRSESGLLRPILNWFRVRRLQSQISELDAATDRYAHMYDANIKYIESVQNSPGMVGARAELAVTDHLRRLPAPCVVLNDVHLHRNRTIMFNGSPLRSAQIDHLVLSPAGVFVIETKCWSGRFTQSAQYHDPFAQAQRARYLCSLLLRKSFGKISIRTIIASLGDLPPSPQDSYIKVLRPDDLVGYISWFTQPELSPQRIDALRRYFESRVSC